MDGITILGIFLVLWGIGTALVAIFKPKGIWKIGKIQGFVQLLGDTGTMILFLVMATIAIVGGVLILV